MHLAEKRFDGGEEGGLVDVGVKQALDALVEAFAGGVVEQDLAATGGDIVVEDFRSTEELFNIDEDASFFVGGVFDALLEGFDEVVGLTRIEKGAHAVADFLELGKDGELEDGYLAVFYLGVFFGYLSRGTEHFKGAVVDAFHGDSLSGSGVGYEHGKEDGNGAKGVGDVDV